MVWGRNVPDSSDIGCQDFVGNTGLGLVSLLQLYPAGNVLLSASRYGNLEELRNV